MMHIISNCIYFLVVGILTLVNGKDIITNNGPVKGKLVNDMGVQYYSYQGIPYAEPPIGPLRFMPPIPKQRWTEVLDATEEGPVCLQAEGNYQKEQMSEDCLSLNIFAPNSSRQLPVLVFVHGGDFHPPCIKRCKRSLSGNSDFIYGPQFFMKEKVILVTMNYRLGALGFLSLEIPEASGNAGIKDVHLALKWIKSNIEHFGGLSNKITLGGNSAGSALVHFLMLSPKSTGLFEQAMLISGSALSYRFLARHPTPNALALASALNIESEDNFEILNKLKKVDVFDIVKAQNSIYANEDTRAGFRPLAPFVPSIEKVSSEAILTEDPIDIIQSGKSYNIPVLVGMNSNEGIKMFPPIFKNSTLIDLLNENFERCIPSNIEYPKRSEASLKLAAAIRYMYFSGNDISMETLQSYEKLIKDTQFTYSIDSWIKYYKESGNSNKLYYYVLNFDGDLNWFKILNNIDYPGTSHADELGYLFVTTLTKPRLSEVDEKTRNVQNLLVTLFSNFIKTGNPTPTTEDGVSWLESGEGRNYFEISDHPRNIPGAPYSDRLQFWYNVYQEYYQYIRDYGQLEYNNVP